MRNLVTLVLAAVVVAVVSADPSRLVQAQTASAVFDHDYRTYASVLDSVVREPRVGRTGPAEPIRGSMTHSYA